MKPPYRKPCREAVDLICGFEKFIPHVYDDGAGFLTIGWGHYLQNPDELAYWRDRVITREEADALLIADLETAARAVMRYITVPLNDYQYGALVSFTFNAGAGTLQRSLLRQKLNRGEYEAVRGELKKYRLSGGKIMRGLIQRRAAEADLFEMADAA